jgi:hypothetical protein
VNSPSSKITSQAAALIREGSVSDRLYEQSFLLSEKKRQQNAKQLQEYKDQIRQRQLGTSSPRSYEQSPSRDSPRIKNRKQQTVISLLEKERGLHHPVINTVSEEIASRLPQTPMERLLGGHSQPKSAYNNNSELYTFRPYINPKSVEIENQRYGATDFHSRVNHWEKQERRKKEKIRAIKRDLEEQELEGCTFSPIVSASPSRRASNKTFDDRNKQWERRRQIKLNRERAAVIRKEMDECPFRPAKSPRGNSAANVGKEEANTREMVGFEEFIARQKSARARKKEEPQPGANWKNKLTKPVEPQLGKRTREKIKALDRPVGKPISLSSRRGSPRTTRYSSPSVVSPNSTPRGSERSTPSRLATGRILNPSTPYRKLYQVEDEDEDEDQNESALDPEHFPRQGLFSSRSTVNILEELRHNFVMNEPPSEDIRSVHARDEDSESEYGINDEWVRRSKTKDRR